MICVYQSTFCCKVSKNVIRNGIAKLFKLIVMQLGRNYVPAFVAADGKEGGKQAPARLCAKQLHSGCESDLDE